jgi:hypothetical protein
MIRILSYMVMFLSLIVPSLFLDHNAIAAPLNEAILTVKASPDSIKETTLSFTNNKIFNLIVQNKFRKPAQDIPVTDIYLIYKRKDGVDITYLVDRKGNLFNEQNNEMIDIPANLKTELMKHIEKLRSAHYGTMVQWDIVKEMVPNQAKFKVIDMETGLTFNVQRRAGNHHADVQPLTKEDTAIMKQIYNGTWSWQRKAILVQTEHQLLAASMHGMPHGGDGIPDNQFSGHFCIHFFGSSTHRTGKIDPEHQLMVHKAAGKLDEYLVNASPYEVADTFLFALNLKESQILKMSFTDANHNQLLYFLQDKDQITRIRKKSNYIEKDASGLVNLEIPIKVSIFRKNLREETTTYTFQMKRASLIDPWKVDSIGISNNK